MAETIQLMRQVAVKAIVTENFKAQVAGEINKVIADALSKALQNK